MIGLERKYPSTYPSDAVAILDAMSFTKGKAVKVIGSMSLRSQLYAGDYDADEEVRGKGDKATFLKHLASEFGAIMKRLRAIPKAVIGDIKCGSVEKFRVLPSNWAEFSTLLSLKTVEDLPVSAEEKSKVSKQLRAVKTEMDFILLKHELKYHTVRWTPDEIIHGSKKVQDGSIMTLEEAFCCPAPVKVDVIGWVSNNHYTEFSMVYRIYCNGELLNDARVDVEKELKEAVKYYEHEGNPFKALKRKFALARLNNDTKEMEKLSEVLNSDLGKIYSILSDIGTLVILLESGKPIGKNIEYEVNSFKERLSHIYTVKGFMSKEEAILKDLDLLLDKPTLKRLQMIEGILQSVLKTHTPMKGGLMAIESMYPEIATDLFKGIAERKQYTVKDIHGKPTWTYTLKPEKFKEPAYIQLKSEMEQDANRFKDLAHFYHNRDFLKGYAYRNLYYDVENFLNRQMYGKADPPMVDTKHLEEAGFNAHKIKTTGTNQYGAPRHLGDTAMARDIEEVQKEIKRLGRANIAPIPIPPEYDATKLGGWVDVPHISNHTGDAGWRETFHLLVAYPTIKDPQSLASVLHKK